MKVNIAIIKVVIKILEGDIHSDFHIQYGVLILYSILHDIGLHPAWYRTQ